MFDMNAEIAFDARVAATSGAVVPIVVRWPTDQEWAARTRARKFIIRRLGRGVSETVPPDPGEADVKLYRTIAVNGAPDMTPAEAAKVLETIGTAEPTGVEVAADEATVEMTVCGGTVHHHMHIPTADQVLAFRRAAVRVLDLPYNQQELRMNTEAGARLYDQCAGRSDDYPNGVPAIHKDQAIRAVIEYIDRNLGPRTDDTNF